MDFFDFSSHHTFKDLIQGEDIYIDKTSHIAELYAGHTTFEMLIRPFGFGKTILLDTLFYLFKYGKDSSMFQELSVKDSPIEIPVESVVKFDFSYIKVNTHDDFTKFMYNFYNNRLFKEDLDNTLNPNDNVYWLTCNFIKFMAEKSVTGKVVLLIDNYDDPITRNYFDPNFKPFFYSLLDFFKAINDSRELIDWCLIFGEMKFQLGCEEHEGIPFINDITYNERSTSICGFTAGEMKKYYPEFIQDEADAAEQSVDMFIGNLTDWYGGFRFTRHNIKVFRPESIKTFLNLREQNHYKPFYSISHKEKFLIEVLKRNKYNIEKLLLPNDCSYSFAEASTINNIHVFGMLSQMGFFSFHHINIDVSSSLPTTTYYSVLTNREMRETYQLAIDIAKKEKNKKYGNRFI